jgi:hypothetical protein
MRILEKSVLTNHEKEDIIHLNINHTKAIGDI